MNQSSDFVLMNQVNYFANSEPPFDDRVYTVPEKINEFVEEIRGKILFFVIENTRLEN